MYLGILRIMRWLCNNKSYGFVTKKRVFTVTMMIAVVSCGTMYYNMQLQQLKDRGNAIQIESYGQKILSEERSILAKSNPSINDYQQVAKIVQEKLWTIQYPNECNNTRIVLCEIPSKGFGRQVHLLTICFTLGFMTERTVIIKTDDGHITNVVWGNLTLPLGKLCFLPKEIPVEVYSLFGTEDIQVIKASFQTNYFDLHRTLPLYIAETVNHFHSNPSLWWAGQVAKFILRPDKRLDILIEERKKELGFVFRTVGIFIETKTKVKQTGQYNFTNIMKLAEKWYRSYELNTGLRNTQKRVFIASDEPQLLMDVTKL